jgi:dienelactone hydrolase
MRALAAALALVLVAEIAAAEAPTPLEQPLAAGEITLIAAPSPIGPKDTLFHYRLYVPADYHDGPERRYPVMFVAAPGGDAEMGAMAERLRRDRWLVVMLVESRNGSLLWYPNFVAAHDDLTRRARVQPGMLFCTGFSGGARLCSTYPAIRPGFRGVILQAASFQLRPDHLAGDNARVVVYGTFGKDDPNLPEAGRVRRGVPPPILSLVEVWDGGHAWAPAPVFERALDWVVDRALLDPAYDPQLSDAYRWYFTNKLAQHESAERNGQHQLLGAILRELPERWQLRLDPDQAAKLATIGPTPNREIEAHDAVEDALRHDQEDRGRDLIELAARYGEIATRYADTAAGAQASIRRQSVLWEAGRR